MEGQPDKTYNLLKCRMLKMRSTGYYVGEKTVPSNVTFTGHKLQRGLVAVDPKVIPLHTRLYVIGYGYAYAADTGSKIKGLRIDLAVKDKYEEAHFNRHEVPVYLLGKARRW
jgi:3D (Asp-Asp-Asp) domain-containing protein